MDELINAMMAKGHSRSTAEAAIAGRGYNDLAREYLGSSGGGGEGGFSFDFEGEVDKAYSELGAYYDKLLEWSQGDLNLALSRLKSDYETGQRYRESNYNLSTEALDLARENFATDADKAYRNLANVQLARGISRESAFGAPGKGIADVEQQRLTKDINLGGQNLDLQEQRLQENRKQADELALTEKTRMEEDLPKDFERQKFQLEEERKQRAGELALSRSQRAFDRFESELI